MAIELTEGGTPRLAISVGSATRGTALSRILSLRGSPGWIAGSEVRKWQFDGVLEREGAVYLVGPHVRGVTLKDVVEQEPGAALPMMSRLARALLKLSGGPAGWFPVQSDSVIFTDSGEVLVLPPAVDREVRDRRPFEEHRETFERRTLGRPTRSPGHLQRGGFAPRRHIVKQFLTQRCRHCGEIGDSQG